MKVYKLKPEKCDDCDRDAVRSIDFEKTIIHLCAEHYAELGSRLEHDNHPYRATSSNEEIERPYPADPKEPTISWDDYPKAEKPAPKAPVPKAPVPKAPVPKISAPKKVAPRRAPAVKDKGGGVPADLYDDQIAYLRGETKR
jgi:hypothetical protein